MVSLTLHSGQHGTNTLWFLDAVIVKHSDEANVYVSALFSQICD